MKAIILSAGQGSRLLPMTQTTPKCLLPVYNDMTALGWQLSQLQIAGIREVVVVTGFHAEKVERELERHSMPTRTIFNPFYKVADNLGSVWMARQEFDSDCLLINGDTLFTAAVPMQVREQARQDITVTVSRKDHYDDDDMKVVESGGRLLEIGKKLQRVDVNGESIGCILFRNAGGRLFRSAIEQTMQHQEALSQYYLSVIGSLASGTPVGIAEVANDQWCETDFPADLTRARTMIASWAQESDDVAIKAVG